jgi:hypothetical protein
MRLQPVISLHQPPLWPWIAEKQFPLSYFGIQEVFVNDLPYIEFSNNAAGAGFDVWKDLGVGVMHARATSGVTVGDRKFGPKMGYSIVACSPVARQLPAVAK